MIDPDCWTTIGFVTTLLQRIVAAMPLVLLSSTLKVCQQRFEEAKIEASQGQD